jgi:C1A family cysteine protease
MLNAALLGKSFPNVAEKNMRFTHWLKTDTEIAKMNNKPNITFRTGHNEFSFMTDEEFKAMLLPIEYTIKINKTENLFGNLEALNLTGPTDICGPTLSNDYGPYMKSANLNWCSTKNTIKKNACNPIQNQGLCGSCWAFSSVGVMESMYKINSPSFTPIKFSE